jgi:tetrapyrrole methylase family protein/MazG family protein
MDISEAELHTFEGLRQIIARLRGPDGCPWDRAQTHTSLKSYLLEETYEALAALDESDTDKLCDELGDLLLEVLLHVQLAEEAREFTLEDVVHRIASKLVRRHPHVFGDEQADTPEQVMARWAALKQEERGDEGSALAGVPLAMPALTCAQRLQERAARVGFQWPDIRQAQGKLEEEIGELTAAGDAEHKREEMGDVLFMIVSLARYLELDAEEALRLANGKFSRRFSGMEGIARERGLLLTGLSLPDLEALWEEARERLRS